MFLFVCIKCSLKFVEMIITQTYNIVISIIEII